MFNFKVLYCAHAGCIGSKHHAGCVLPYILVFLSETKMHTSDAQVQISVNQAAKM